MPISGPSSYVPTTQAFFTHWEAANLAFPGPPTIELEDGTTVMAFQAKMQELLDKREALEEADVEVAFAREQLNMAKESLHARAVKFNAAVRARISKTVYARMLPAIPGIEAGQEVFTKPLLRIKQIWAKINAALPPPLTSALLLQGGDTQSQFAIDFDALLPLYSTLAALEQALSLMMEERNDIQDVLYDWMKEYRLAIAVAFPEGDAQVESLPKLTSESSRTPDPVALSGAWDAGLSAAQLTAGVSTDPDLEEYELRWCAGASYSTESEHVAGSIPQGSPPVFVTTKGLTISGHTACYRVYVRLHDGGEAGSDTVVITRP